MVDQTQIAGAKAIDVSVSRERVTTLELENAAALSRVATLEAEIGAARSRLATLEAALGILPETRGDDPDDAALRKLLAVTRAAFPQLGYGLDKYADGFGRFCSAFRWAGSVQRCEKPNEKDHLSLFLGDARDWCRQRGIVPNDLQGADLILAAIARGDVAFVVQDESVGQSWAIGLMRYGGGRKAEASAWRKVLAGNIVSPSPPRPASHFPKVQRYGVAI